MTGDRFRRVDLIGTPRTGVLTQASVLTVTSYSTRTSPVLRGKWILENILNEPPPPPPANVPALRDPSPSPALRCAEQLEEHRANPACAGCHARMDPLGFGLENSTRSAGGTAWNCRFRQTQQARCPTGRRAEVLAKLASLPLGASGSFRAC